jgi:hypothetical protein
VGRFPNTAYGAGTLLGARWNRVSKQEASGQLCFRGGFPGRKAGGAAGGSGQSDWPDWPQQAAGPWVGRGSPEPLEGPKLPRSRVSVARHPGKGISA